LNSLSTAVHLEYEVTNRVTMEIKKAKFDVVVYHYCSDKVLIAPSSNLGRAYDMFSGPQTIPLSKFTTEALCEVDVTFYNKDSA
jgi:uroporphyrinogen-III decarboxylase